MNKYELAVVVNGRLDEDGKNDVLGKVKDLVTRFGGEIKNVDEWGKKRFAYELHKMRDGYYTFIKFEAESAAPAEIESRMRIMDGVERYLIVKDELGTVVNQENPVEAAPAEKEAAEEAPAAVEAPAAEEAPAEEAPAETEEAPAETPAE